jgi:hypothetical protein
MPCQREARRLTACAGKISTDALPALLEGTVKASPLGLLKQSEVAISKFSMVGYPLFSMKALG